MIAIIIFGPPGSGKGTQAKLLADKFGLIHFDTGKYIEQVVHNPLNKKNKIIQRERKLFDSGALCTPDWVLKIISEKTEKLAEAGFGIIFSGSPRTFFEAFGKEADLASLKLQKAQEKKQEKQEGLIKVLEKLYGKKNIFIFRINISAKDSINRNSNRLICLICGAQLMATFKDVSRLKICPFCGGKLYRRVLDNPETIRIRLKEYRRRTLPVISELKKHNYKIININGRPLPSKVFQSILKRLNLD